MGKNQERGREAPWAHLEAVAKAALPDWTRDEDGSLALTERTGAYMAAASPVAVLSLMETIRLLQERDGTAAIPRLVSQRDRSAADAARLSRQLAKETQSRADAEAKALEKDAELIEERVERQRAEEKSTRMAGYAVSEEGKAWQAHRESLAKLAQVRALVTERGPSVSCGGPAVTDDGCFAGSLAQRVLAVLGPAQPYVVSMPREAAHEPDREGLETVIGAVLFNASNYPKEVQPHIIGRRVDGLRTRVTDAVLAHLRREARRG